MHKVGNIIEQVLRRNKLWSAYQAHLLVEKWPELAGPAIAEISRAEQILNGVLYVTVKDSVWAYHLTLMKPKFIDKLNECSDNTRVKDINFRIGSLVINNSNGI